VNSGRFDSPFADADDDAVEQPRRAAHEVLVTARERVERAGIDDGQHGASR
jgi:hypothetical protein